jgi:hypothetical protein
MTDDLYSELAELREDRENLAKEVMHLAAALIYISTMDYGRSLESQRAKEQLDEWKAMRKAHGR